MLSNSQVPRPQPPAKVRRMSSNIKSTPPPPYAATSNTSRNPPFRLSIPSLMAGVDGLRQGAPLTSPAAEDWLNGHSRADLSELLLKADELIKDRESDIGVTSAACKSLHENSVVLKNKHEAFLRKIPFSPSHSPSVSVSPSPANSTAPLPNSPHFYAANLSRWPADSSVSTLSPPIHRRHTRKISVSQNDIALLSDQNAELVSKLETLETECAQAEQAARRKLSQLEKEIQGLRQELETTQLKNEELEEKAKAGLSKAEAAWRKKLEREEMVKALRGNSDSDPGGEVKDFAPGSNAISGGRSAESTPTRGVQDAGSNSRSFCPAFDFPPKETRPLDHDDVFSSPPLKHSKSRSFMSPSQRELAVVAQLLTKIQELQEANEQISEQQAKTASTLHSVHKDAESIRKLYECLGDGEGVEWQIVPDEDREKVEGEKKQAEDETIRFQSFRRSLELDVPPTEDYFSSGIGGNMQSTVNEAALSRIVLNHKTRKSVVGLFDTPGTSSPPSPSIVGARAPLSIDTDTSQLSHTSTLPSPALSTLSFAVTSPSNEQRPTLRSELGSEFGEDWGRNTGNHHLRNTSLYQLCIPSTSSSPAPISPPTQASPTISNKTHKPLKLQNASSYGRSTLLGHQTNRYHRLSQTVRARTNQWLDGRFKETLLNAKHVAGQSPDDEIGAGLPSPLAPVPQKLPLAAMFDSVVGTFTGVGEQEPASPEHGEESDSQAMIMKVHKSSDPANEKKRQGVTRVILELWLWLQFAIIILVFLWAMAKRGPKSVLGEANSRRLAPAKHS